MTICSLSNLAKYTSLSTESFISGQYNTVLGILFIARHNCTVLLSFSSWDANLERTSFSHTLTFTSEPYIMVDPSQNQQFAALSLFLVGTCFGWKIPSISFLESFAMNFNREGLVVYLPEYAVIDNRIVKIICHFR